MIPFSGRLCMCRHARDIHRPEWGWTACCGLGCRCPAFRWARLGWWWNWRDYRAARRAGRG